METIQLDTSLAKLLQNKEDVFDIIQKVYIICSMHLSSSDSEPLPYRVDMKRPPLPTHRQVGPGSIVQGHEFTNLNSGGKLHAYDYRVTNLTTSQNGRVLEIINTEHEGHFAIVPQAELERISKGPKTPPPPSRVKPKIGRPPPPSGKVARSIRP